jgi:transcriptional regulator with XRE-family HTH domain
MSSDKITRLAQELGVSEETFLSPFKRLERQRVLSLLEGIKGMSAEEQRYFVWHHERLNYELAALEKLRRMPWWMECIRFYNDRLTWLFLPYWNSKQYAEWWERSNKAAEQVQEETAHLQHELFGDLSEAQRKRVENYSWRFKDEMLMREINKATES